MTEPRHAPLPDRGVIAVSGPDARPFLQGLVSNDVNKVSADSAIYAALLTAQGKYLFDFFIAETDGRLLLEGEAARLADLVKRLSLYKLRSKVTVEDASGAYAVAACFGPGAAAALGLEERAGAAAGFASGVAFVDPRLAAAGVRAILPRDGAEAALRAAGFAAAAPEDYDRHRLGLGLPDGSRDLIVDKSVLLEANFEALNGVDFHKGCYVGQEVTARTKYRGLVRKRLLRVDVDGPLPAPGTPIMLDGKEAGTMQSGRDGVGIALLRLEQVEAARQAGQPLIAGEARLKPVKPGWADF